MDKEKRLQRIFNTLLERFGKRDWWPGETPFEVIVGAVLTQNTSWKNVEKAISSMKDRGVLDMERLRTVEESELAGIIRSAGFFNIKARRLKNLINALHDRFDGSLAAMKEMDLTRLRPFLLQVNGLGPETVDSILLYALDKPVFVVDAYTKRFLSHHGLYGESSDYHDVQRYFLESLPADMYLFNEFHALIVVLCQTYCRKKPLCEACPLKGDLEENAI
jgi:endonuclease III related protein